VHGRKASSHKCGAVIFIQSEVIDIFSKLMKAAAAILDLLGGAYGTTHEDTFVVRTPCKNFVMIGLVV